MEDQEEEEEQQELDHEMAEPIASNRGPIIKETPQILSAKDGRQYLPWVEKYRPSR